MIPGTINIPGCTSNTGGNNPAADTFASCFARLGGILPTTAINPVAATVLKNYVPLPNTNGTNYTFNPTTTEVQDQALVRVDFNPTAKDQLDFVGIYQHFPESDTTPFTGPSLPGFGDVNTSEIRQLTINYVRQLSSTALNVFALHYSRFNLGAVAPATPVAPSTAGFAINPQNTAGESLPQIALTSNFTTGFTTNGPQPRVDQNYQIDDNVSKTLGRHQLKFGYDGRRFNVDNEFAGTNNGAYTFTATQSANPNTSGNVVLDLLLGDPASYGQGAGGRISAQSSENYFFGQDTWKVSSNFTLDYGLGWQIDSAIHNRQYGNEGVECFIPGQQSKIFPTAPLSLNFPGDPGCNNAQGATTVYRDVSPRLGFAYSPDLGFLSGNSEHKLSIRGGFGIYYNRSEGEGSLQNLSQAPFGINSVGVRDAQTAPNDRSAFGNPYENVNTGATIPNPFPAAFPAPGSTNVVFPGNPLYISQYAPNYRIPYSENFQLSIERELPGQNILTLSYVGSLGRKNQTVVEGNPITPAGHAACLADPTCIADASDQNAGFPSHTLYPQAITSTGDTHFASDAQIGTEGSSNFNAFEASVKKGVTHGLAGQISYTYSHALDTVSSYEGGGFGGERGYNQYQPSLNYGNADFDARQRLVIAPIYIIPTHGDNQFTARNLLTSGWEVSFITTFATGHPYDIAYDGATSNSLWCSNSDYYYTCPDVPNQVAPLQKLNPHNPLNNGQFFNPAIDTPGASFTSEAIGTFGNEARNRYFGPGLDFTNIVLAKNFNYSKENSAHTIQLRLESYNVFNHSNFANPSGSVNGQFGTIVQLNTNVPARQTQLVGKIYF